MILRLLVPVLDQLAASGQSYDVVHDRPVPRMGRGSILRSEIMIPRPDPRFVRADGSHVIVVELEWP